MTPSNAASLRTLLRHLAASLAVSSAAACGAVVSTNGGDAAVADVPVTDVPAVDAPVSDADRCASYSTSVGNPCFDQGRMFPCGLPAGVVADDGGTLASSDCMALCGNFSGIPSYSCSVARPDGGAGVLVRCNYACGTGRRTDGVDWAPVDCDGPGGWFAHVSALEGMAVHAFARMGDELEAWGAPASLREGAARARRDEVAHATATAALARRFGAEPVSFDVEAPAPRGLVDAALENAVEGCVRETWGALVAWWQAGHAGDASVAAVLRAVAEDETRHAALSWELDAWLLPQLDDAGRSRVHAARSAALTALRGEIADPPPAVTACAGVPTRAEAEALFDALAPTLAAA